MDSPVGLVGRLTHGTRGTAGPGEVVLAIRGGTERFIATSQTPLAAGTSVLVVNELGPRTVEVEPWEGTLAASGPN